MSPRSAILLGGVCYAVLVGTVSCVVCQENCAILMTEYGWYLAPLLPLFRFAINGISFKKQMATKLSLAEQEEEGGQALILTLAGFSFAAFFLIIVESIKKDFADVDVSLSAYYMFVSFFSFFLAYSVGFFRFYYWVDELRYSLEEVGRFSLLASAVAIFWITRYPTHLKIAMLTIAAVGWLAIFAVRIHLRRCYFAGKKPIWPLYLHHDANEESEL